MRFSVFAVPFFGANENGTGVRTRMIPYARATVIDHPRARFGGKEFIRADERLHRYSSYVPGERDERLGSAVPIRKYEDVI